MMNPFEKLLKEICEALNKLIKMVIFVAERTLSAKEFTEFTEEFTNKTDQKNANDLFSKEWEVDD